MPRCKASCSKKDRHAKKCVCLPEDHFLAWWRNSSEPMYSSFAKRWGWLRRLWQKRPTSAPGICKAWKPGNIFRLCRHSLNWKRFCAQTGINSSKIVVSRGCFPTAAGRKNSHVARQNREKIKTTEMDFISVSIDEFKLPRRALNPGVLLSSWRLSASDHHGNQRSEKANPSARLYLHQRPDSQSLNPSPQTGRGCASDLGCEDEWFHGKYSAYGLFKLAGIPVFTTS